MNYCQFSYITNVIKKTLAHFKVQVNFHVHITHSPRLKIEYTFAMVGDYVGMDLIIFKLKLSDTSFRTNQNNKFFIKFNLLANFSNKFNLLAKNVNFCSIFLFPKALILSLARVSSHMVQISPVSPKGANSGPSKKKPKFEP